MQEGFFRVAAVVPQVRPADVKSNVDAIVEALERLEAEGVDLAVMPEMCITGYTCADLFHQRTLLDGARRGLDAVAAATAGRHIAAVVGLPMEVGDTLYNCAALVANGAVQGIVPKTYLPNYNEFYEKRWWAAAPRQASGTAPDAHTLFDIGGVKVGIEICEDLWAPIPPSTHAALAGAEVIVNLSASNDVIGKYDYLLSLIRQQSARCLAAYVYAGAGFGESSTDMVFDGKAIIAENGALLAVNARWQQGLQYRIADIDIAALRRDRMHIGTFHDCAERSQLPIYNVVEVRTPYLPDQALADLARSLRRYVEPHPFVPATDEAIDRRCTEIVNIQVAGLAQRLSATGCKCLVIGISGGLDSTLALLVATRAFDRLGLPRTGIIGVTMPGFGTTERTRTNAEVLMERLGVTPRKVSINAAVMQHFADIGHNPDTRDVTYENCQARERTQILMDIANQEGGMVLGTGDLSELALGWATYNGDHMSMYGVNASVPKTLVKYLVRWFMLSTHDAQEADTLADIIDTPISPELIPADANDNITQKTEDLVGPYELHDFFLYYTLRYGFSPRRVYLLALRAFGVGETADAVAARDLEHYGSPRTLAVGRYATDDIRHWMREFYRRFFNQQFKRSCMPDGPKVGSVCLSPRGDWRMPSDASSALWLAEVDNL